ncbi:MAG: hypothetical protein PVH54_06480, partial [Gammaproteobacteria bacterium]
MARIVFSGYMIRYPLTGMLMAFFHYILGLYRLGHQVTYIEESGWPMSCYDPLQNEHGEDPSVGFRIVRQLMEFYGVDIPICY